MNECVWELYFLDRSDVNIFILSLEATETVGLMILTYFPSQAPNTACLHFLQTAPSLILSAVLRSNVSAANLVCLLVILLLIYHISVTSLFSSPHTVS